MPGRWGDRLFTLLMLVIIGLVIIWTGDLILGISFVSRKYIDSAIELMSAIVLIVPSTVFRKVPWWIRITLSSMLILGNFVKLLIVPLLR